MRAGVVLAIAVLALTAFLGAPASAASAPKLKNSVFRWDGRRWRMVSHANFNVPL